MQDTSVAAGNLDPGICTTLLCHATWNRKLRYMNLLYALNCIAGTLVGTQGAKNARAGSRVPRRRVDLRWTTQV